MKQHTLPIEAFYVLCDEDDDLTEEFGSSQYKEALDYLIQQRRLWPNKYIRIVANIYV